MRCHAATHGLDLVVLDWPGHPAWPMSSKFMVWRVLEHYARILFVDADVVIPPGSDCPLSFVPPTHAGLFDESRFHRGQDQHGRMNAYAAFCQSHGFPSPTPFHPYYNTGVYVLSRAHRDLLAPPDRLLAASHCSEQDLMNVRIAQSGVPVFELPREYHWQWWPTRSLADAPLRAWRHLSGMGWPDRPRVAREESLRVLPPAAPALILSTPRTGTNLLGDALRQAAGLDPDEWLHPDDRPGPDGRTGLDAAVAARGLKAHLGQMEARGLLDRPPNELLPGCRVIRLSRRDRLRQAVSLMRAQQTGQWRSVETPCRDPEYDRAAIARALADLDRWEMGLNSYCDRHCIRPYQVWYEDLAADPQGVVSGVLAYLGVDPHTPWRTELVRQADSLTEEWLERFLTEG
jgi:LPS sulfotransferase NodH